MVTPEYDGGSMLNYMANVWIGMWSKSISSNPVYLLEIVRWVNTWPGQWKCGTK